LAFKISELRHRIKIQSLTRSSDGQGGWNESWSDFVEVWASIKPSSASERYFSQKIEMNVTHKIVVRWLDGLTQEMRIDFEGRIFQIKGIRRQNEQRFFIEIDAQENVGS
jgi:SPP1 family predicted phage head-tail adaptor